MPQPRANEGVDDVILAAGANRVYSGAGKAAAEAGALAGIEAGGGDDMGHRFSRRRFLVLAAAAAAAGKTKLKRTVRRIP